MMLIENAAKTIDHDIVIAADQTLVIKNSRLYFAKGCGIFCEGRLEAYDTLFCGIENDTWANVSAIGKHRSILKNCTFKNARGRQLRDYKNCFAYRYFGFVDDVELQEPHEKITKEEKEDFYKETYAGALACLNTSVNECTFISCSCECEGGGVYAMPSTDIIGCKFQECCSKENAGAVKAIDSQLQKCSFKKCASGDLGGALILEGYSNVTKCSFDRCSTHNLGAAIAVLGTGSKIAFCLFKNCSSDRGSIVDGAFALHECDFLCCSGETIACGQGCNMAVTSCRFYKCEAFGFGIVSSFDPVCKIGGCAFLACKAKRSIIRTYCSLLKNNRFFKNSYLEKLIDT